MQVLLAISISSSAAHMGKLIFPASSFIPLLGFKSKIIIRLFIHQLKKERKKKKKKKERERERASVGLSIVYLYIFNPTGDGGEKGSKSSVSIDFGWPLTFFLAILRSSAGIG